MDTLDQVRRRWCEGDNIGIACRASRIVGLDLDVDGDGAGRLAALACELGRDWPDAFAVRKPSGWHLYFRVGPGCTVASVSGGRSRLGPGSTCADRAAATRFPTRPYSLAQRPVGASNV
ncbi:bifunctional DNA primase/polymerase [Nocardia sp. NPDC059239]|uniref:bifunctional DNA primase/polymerase n=1 Tax=Nocardia sp. NPDC059239 TaxID=3346785 RepID=UPI0036CE2290